MKPHLEGFRTDDIGTQDGIHIRVEIGGSGPPLLLLHGHPQTHATWHKIAPILAKEFTVVAPDLRGYGDSSKPHSEKGAAYRKSLMALDQVDVMAFLGFPQFAVVGHDRGGRVAHRLVLDHPQSVSRVAFFDIAPTLHMYSTANQEFATKNFWWFFLIQAEPLPERLIGSEVEFFLREHLRGQSKTEGIPEAHIAAEYLRCYNNPDMIHAVCEDYRASATTDLDQDRKDHEGGVTFSQPMLALWSMRGTVGSLYDVLAVWKSYCTGPVSGTSIDCGHLLQEERPREVLERLLPFLRS